MGTRSKLGYIISLPERLGRAIAGVLGGGLLVLADVLIPEVLQKTTLYYILLGGSVRYAVERVAGMHPMDVGTEHLPPLPAQYYRRKLAGTAIEGLGLLTVQFSPLWVFAIAGDAAAGSKVFLHRLEAHLKSEDVIPADATITDLTDLLDALQEASRMTARILDTPPLSRKDLEELSSALKSSYSELFAGSRDLVPRFERLWMRMRRLSDQEGLPVDRVGALMAQGTISWLKKSRKALTAVSTTGTQLFGEQVLQGYQRTLEEVSRAGVRSYLLQQYGPFLNAAQRQFSPSFVTWTEKKCFGLDPRGEH
jgi:hypothetical protein